MSEYGTPEIRVMVGGWLASNVASVQVVTDRAAPVGLAVVDLDLEDLPTPRPATSDLVTIDLGFAGGSLTRAFAGRVRATEPKRLLQLICHDRMRDLGDVFVREALRNVRLQDVVRRLLDRAGLPSDAYELSSAATTERHLFVAARKSALVLLEGARQAWGVPWDLYARADGRIVFAPWAETAEALAEPVLDLVYGENLLELTPRPEGTGTAASLLAPWVRSGHRVQLTDSRLWQRAVVARVERCTHQVAPAGGGRTRIEWTLAN